MIHKLIKLGALAALFSTAPAQAQDAEGAWTGTLTPAPGMELRIKLVIEKGEDSAFSATLYSLDQGNAPIPTTNVVNRDGSLSFDVPAVSGGYTARWNDDSKSFEGQWRQGGAELPLTLKRAAHEAAAVKPAKAPTFAKDWVLPPLRTVEKILDDAMVDRPEMAMAAVIIGPGRKDIMLRQGESLDDEAAVRFEIGSISKSMTGLLLADMVVRGEVSLDDPAQDYMPAGVNLPTGKDGRAILLADLSRHTSGLPRLPSDFRPRDMDNPYADYDETALLKSLATIRLQSEPGEKVSYSNLGTGLLGYLMARAAKQDLATLMSVRIFKPLEMADTSLGDAAGARVAQPHNHKGLAVPDWDMNALAGAGAVRSSGADMAKYLDMLIAPNEEWKAKVDLLMAGAVGDGEGETGLGLFRRTSGDKTILFHNGQTGGSKSMMMIRPDTGEGVVILSNDLSSLSPDVLAMHLLLGRSLD